MPLDFPTNPAVGTYYNGYIWDGTVWDSALQPSVPALLTTAPVYANEAARTSAVPSPAEGQLSYLNDINQFQGYAGTSWRGIGGMVPIVAPTVNFSGGSATANSLGRIDFSAVTSISLNNIFSSNYKNYKIIISGMSAASASTSVSFRYRVSGVDESSAKYYGQGMYQNNISSYAASSWSGTTSSPFANATTNTYSGSVIEILEPFTSTKKTMAFDSTMGYAGGLVGSWHQSIHDLDMSVDGFTVFASAAITGSIQVLGYNA